MSALELVLTLLIAAGVVPFVMAAGRLQAGATASACYPQLGSILLATLAFNLTFFWQELWLVIPKAWTPGLSPTLYHNNHDWTGASPIVELLQGTGSIATLVSGLAFTAILAKSRRLSTTWRVFVFWMAFQGLFQSLSQFAIGAVIRGNDVGRALSYLGLGSFGRAATLAATLAAIARTGFTLAPLLPSGVVPAGVFKTRGCAWILGTTGAAVALLSVPFRIPRNAVEVLLIPVSVNLIGIAWLLLGATFVTRTCRESEDDSVAVLGPVIALFALLGFFQGILRAGVSL